MKPFYTLLATVMLSAASLNAFSQTTKVYESVASAAHGYVEKNGVPGAKGITIQGEVRGDDGLPKNERQLSNWTDPQAHAVWYFHHPAATVNTAMRLTIKKDAKVKFKITISNPQDSTVLLSDTLELTGTGAAMDTTFASVKYPSVRYYRYEFECLDGTNTNLTNIDQFMFRTTNPNKSYVANYLSSPSVHLSNWRPTLTSAPKGNIFDFAYMEVMIPKSSDIVGTYCMSLGVLAGYMGIQHDGLDKNGVPQHNIIFSMWDKGSTDQDPNLPDYLRAGAVDYDPLTTINRFGGEGTGAQAKRFGYYWYPDTFVQFICNARPENTSYSFVSKVDTTYTYEENGKNVTKAVKTGEKVTLPQNNVLVSAWFNAQDGKGWQYLATIRIRNTKDLIANWYSFLENYNWPTGNWNRRAYYRKGFLHEYSTGKWYNCNQVGFGHTDGGTATGVRNDYGQGRAEAQYPNTFYMQTGGYVNHTSAADNVAYATDFTPVDTIKLEPLLARVQEGVDKEIRKQQEEEEFNKNIYQKNGWEVIYKSDEEASGEGTNGRAALIIDGDDETYYHSQWKGTRAEYPHIITVDMKKDTPVGSYQIKQSKSNGKWTRFIKSYKMWGSTDNENWTLLYSDDDAPDKESFRVFLDSTVNIRYFKLEVTAGRASEGPFIRINEVDMSPISAKTVTDGINAIKSNYNDGNAELTISGTKASVVPNKAGINNATLLAYTSDGRVAYKIPMTKEGNALVTDISAIKPGLYLLVANWENGCAVKKYMAK